MREIAIFLLLLAACKAQERRFAGPTTQMNIMARLGECAHNARQGWPRRGLKNECQNEVGPTADMMLRDHIQGQNVGIAFGAGPDFACNLAVQGLIVFRPSARAWVLPRCCGAAALHSYLCPEEG